MSTNWFNESCIYHTYPLGMLGVKDDHRENGVPPVNRIGELNGWIPYLKTMGIDTLFLGPIFESEYHGYDTIDYHRIDRRLGSWEDMTAVSRMYSTSGIRLILDGVFNHVGKEFFAFQDILVNGESSVYKEWFFIDLSRPTAYEPFSYQCWEGHPELVELNLGNQALKDYLFGAVRRWILDFDISGIRLDVAYHLDHDFMRELKSVCREIKDDFILLGEVIHGDYHTYMQEGMLDSVTNYECYKGLYSSHNEQNCYEIAYSLKRQFSQGGLYEGAPLYNFVDNHDVNRVASLLQDPRYLYTLYILLMTMPGVPSLYYGSEQGLEGMRTEFSDEPLRPRMRMGFSRDTELLSHISKLIGLRKGDKSLMCGDYREIALNNTYLGYSRSCDTDETLILINISGEPIHIQLEEVRYEGFFIDRLNHDEKIYIENGVTYIEVRPYWGRILTSVK